MDIVKQELSHLFLFCCTYTGLSEGNLSNSEYHILVAKPVNKMPS